MRSQALGIQRHWSIIVWLTGATVAAAAGGALATTRAGPTALVVVAGLTVTAGLLWRFGIGVAVAILLLGAVDALPGPNLEFTKLPLGLYGIDADVVVLVIMLVVINQRRGFETLSRTRVGRWTSLWALCLIVWWLLTLARTVVFMGAKLQPAVYFGHDFAYFAVLLPLLLEPMRNRRIRDVTCISLGVGAAVIVAVQVAATLGYSSPILLHTFSQTLDNGSTGNITRIYASADNMLAAAFPLALGFTILGHRVRYRVAAGFLSAGCIVAIALTLTRALYVGLIVGLGTAVAIWLLRRDESGRLVRRQFVRVVAVGAVVTVTLLTYQPAVFANSAVSGVTERFTSLFAAVASPDPRVSTIAIRQMVDGNLEQMLGSKWPIGLGFLDPKDHYVPSLPQGSIRDSDTGVLNAVMTMGVIGTLLIFAPLIGVGIGLVASRLKRTSTIDQWLRFGTVAWVIMALVSSISLVLLFSAPGLVTAAWVLAMGASVLVSSDRTDDLSGQMRPPEYGD